MVKAASVEREFAAKRTKEGTARVKGLTAGG